MAIQALMKFRQKYPQYSDRTDEELAVALAEKYPEAYGFLPKLVERERVISAYNPMTQRAAMLAEKRPNMLQAALEEANKPVTGNVLAALKQLGAFGLKGVAAAGQGIEGLYTAPIVAMQRGQFNPLDIAHTTSESVTGQAPTEVGDIFRNVGAPEPVAQVGGLVGSAFLPGFKQVKGVVGATRRATGTLVGAARDTVVRGTARTHLPILARIDTEAVEHGLKKRFGFIKLGETRQQIQENITQGVNKIQRAASYVKSRASRFQARMLRKHGNDIVDASGITAGVRDVADKSNLYMKDAAGEVLENARGDIQLNPLPGNAKLHRIIVEVESASKAQGDRLTVNQIKSFQKRVRSIAGEERYREVYAAANQLDNSLSAATHQITDVQKADKLYATVMEVIEGSERKSLVGVKSLYTPSKRGATAAEKYFKLEPKAKTVLQTLEDMRLPNRKRFLDNLKDVVAAGEFEAYKPQAGISLLGLGASIAKPSMIPAVAGAVALSSKRGSGILYKTLLSGGLRGTPAQNTFMELIAEGVVDPALIRAAREQIMGVGQEEE